MTDNSQGAWLSAKLPSWAGAYQGGTRNPPERYSAAQQRPQETGRGQPGQREFGLNLASAFANLRLLEGEVRALQRILSDTNDQVQGAQASLVPLSEAYNAVSKNVEAASARLIPVEQMVQKTSAACAELQAEINLAEERCDEVHLNIGKIVLEAQALQQQLKTMEQSMSEVETSLTSLITKVDDLEKRVDDHDLE